MRDITIPRGSYEYVEFTLTDPSGVDLTEDVVELAIGGGDDRVWLAATWDDGYARTTAPVLFDETYSISVHPVWARVTDNTERPIVRLGSIRVVR